MDLLSCPLPTLSAYRSGSHGIPYVVELHGRKQGPTVMISALIHGNEICGAFALDQYLQLRPEIVCGRLICVFANIAAYQKFNRRYPFANRYLEEDMNRLWDLARLNSQEKNQELRRARQLLPLVMESDYILDLHSMGQHETPLILAGQFEQDIQFAYGLRSSNFIIGDAGHAQGIRLRDFKPRTSIFGSKPVSLLIECGQHWQMSSVDIGKQAIEEMLWLTGLSQMRPTYWQSVERHRHSSKVIDVTNVVEAQHTDFFFPESLLQKQLTYVSKGEIIAYQQGKPLYAPYDHCYLIMPAFKPVKGYTAVRLGRERSLV